MFLSFNAILLYICLLGDHGNYGRHGGGAGGAGGGHGEGRARGSGAPKSGMLALLSKTEVYAPVLGTLRETERETVMYR
jgi:hypothetical protein